jgi:hypothetical protein
MRPMYAFKIKVDPNVAWAIPELTRVSGHRRDAKAYSARICVSG